MSRLTRAARGVVVLVATLVTAGIGVGVFLVYADSLADVLGILFATVVTLVGLRIGSRLADSVAAPYDVAEVTVQGPITRDGRGLLPRMPGVAADAVVEQIERADDDEHARGLLVELNTPGGQVVPSDDIRRAVESFDGPTVAYATDVCASGGYWIASGCDRLVARDASLVGSIGVIGSRLNARDLAERLGISYERLAAGKFKDAGSPLKEWTEEDRAYLQGIIDDFYDAFVERVADGRDLEADEIRETEARVFLGGDAADRGLVDEVGTDEEAKAFLADELGIEEARTREFEPSRGLRERLSSGASAVAYAFGVGVASVVAEDDYDFRLR